MVIRGQSGADECDWPEYLPRVAFAGAQTDEMIRQWKESYATGKTPKLDVDGRLTGSAQSARPGAGVEDN